jgi:predicted SnoaL-like aldol condensation-catalyzing enzyme
VKKVSLLVTLVVLSLCASLYAHVDPSPAEDQVKFLQSKDPKLAANKKLVYDFWREVLEARHLDLCEKYMRPDYIQHNPNADTGIAGFKAYFQKLGGPQAIQPKIQRPLISIAAESDYVMLNFVYEQPEPKNSSKKYNTTWFDVFRIQDGKIAEHWDSALKGN